MTDALSLDTRSGLPDALRVLVEAYPRDRWTDHSNFNDLVQFWMQRHMMFRGLMDALQSDARMCLAGDMPADTFNARLSRNAGVLLNELHVHHQIEDHHYFPQLVTLDTRLTRGFDVLDRDHDAMDGLLHEMADSTNDVLRGGEVGRLLDTLVVFAGLLERHLTDEEEIVVPVILDTGFRG